MKKTQFIDVIRDIKKNIVSIISLFVFVSVSVTIFFGISWYINSMDNSYDEYLANGMANNIEYYFAYGASEEDLTKLAQVEDVDIVEGDYVAYAYAQIDGSSLISEFKTYGGELNKIELLEGSYPQGENEVLVEQYCANDYGLKVGDIITVEREDTTQYYLGNKFKQGVNSDDAQMLEDESESKHYALKSNQFKVTGIVASSTQTVFAQRPYYYQNLEMTKLTFFVDEKALDLSNFLGYNKVYVYSQKLTDLSITSQEYSDVIEELVTKLDPIAEEINDDGFLTIKNGYKNLLDDLSSKLDEADAEIVSGEQELANANEKYNTALTEIAKAQKDLATAKQELADGKVKLADSKAQLDSAYNELTSSTQSYDSSKEQFESKKVQLENIESILKNELYLSTNELEPVKSTLIDDVSKWVKDFLVDKNFTYTDDQIVQALKESDDQEIKDFVTLCASAIQGQEADDNLYIYANNLINNKKYIFKDETKIPGFTRGILAFTYTGNLLDIIDNNQDLLKDSELTSQSETLDDIKANYELACQYNDLISMTSLMYSGDGNNSECFIREVEVIKETFDGYDEQINYYEGQLAKAKLKLDDGWNQYHEYENLYQTKLAEYNSGLTKYNNGVNELADAKEELVIGKQKIEQAEKDLAAGQEEYADGLKGYEQLLENYEELKQADYVKLYKANALSISVIETTASICGKARDSLVGMYFVIALLICYSVISRMINDAIRQIGTKKALGFTKSEIFLHYLLIIVIILVVSFVLGTLSSFLVQYIVSFAMGDTFMFPINKLYFSLKDVTLMFIIYLLVFGLITYLSCNNIVKQTAISLLNNNSNNYHKKHFYEHFKIWNKLTLLAKATINNCFNDTRRVFSTIVGISSCTILLISAMTLGNNVAESFKIQYRDYYHFDTLIYYDADNSDSKEIEKILNDEGISTLNLFSENIYVKIDGNNYSGNYFVYQSGTDISDYMELKSSTQEPFNGEGIWVSAGLKDILGLEVGDTINIESLKGETLSGPISGFIDEHVANIGVYIDSNTYSKLSGDEYKPNALIFNKGDYSIKEIESMLVNAQGVVSIMDFVSFENEINNLFVALTGVIELIYFSASLILGIFVILNLLITLVEEKRHEVIVLMVNGYSSKKAKRYIYTDTIYLTIISIIIGVIIGNIVGIKMVKQMEEVYIFFIHTYNLMANLVAVGITILLVVVMCFIALKRVDKFKLNEATQ